MHKESINRVWLERDLRTQDHEQLSLIAHPDTSLGHLQFCYHAIKGINESLKNYILELHARNKKRIKQNN